MQYGFEIKKSKETKRVRNFKRWNKEKKEFTIVAGITNFALGENGLYQESLGTVVDDNDNDTGETIIFVSKEDSSAKKEEK